MFVNSLDGSSEMETNCFLQCWINHSGAHTNIKRGLFSHTRSQDFLIFSGVHFSSPQKLTTFLVVAYV